MISSISTALTSQIQAPNTPPAIAPHGPVRGHHGHGGASKAAADLISSADTDSDGSISKDELTAMMAKNSGSNDASAVSAKVDAIFKQIDTDGNGQISKVELTSALKKAHDQMKSQPTAGSDSSTANGLASLMSNLMSPPDAGYNASGASTGVANVTTFSAVA